MHRMFIALLLLSLPIFGIIFPVASSSQEKKSNDGSRLFETLNCVMCHGMDRKGTTLAPGLKGIKKNWTRPSLIAYLKDPMGVTQKNPRLKKNKLNYQEMDMPGFESVAEKELNQLVEYLMTLK